MRIKLLLILTICFLSACDKKGIKEVSYSQLGFHSDLSEFFQTHANDFDEGTMSHKERQREIDAEAREFISSNEYDKRYLVEKWRCVFKERSFDEEQSYSGVKNPANLTMYKARCHYPMTTKKILWKTALDNVGGAFEPDRLLTTSYWNTEAYGQAFPYFTYWIDKGSIDKGKLQKLNDSIKENDVIEFSGIIETCSATECFIRPANIEKVGYYKPGMVINSLWWSFKDTVRRTIKGI